MADPTGPKSPLETWMTLLEHSRNPTRIALFVAWLAGDPDRARQFLEASQARARVSSAMQSVREAVEALARQGQLRRAPMSMPPPPPYHFALGLSSAVCAILIALGSWLLVVRALPDLSFYSTGVGGLQHARLADGSLVDLNTSSAMRVQMGARRKVELLRGEAHFVVAPDATRPFLVKAGTTLVRAVGTKFTVRLIDAGHQTVVMTEGRVEITDLSNVRRFHGLLGGEPQTARQPHIATGGEVVSVDAGKASITTVPPQEVARRDAWRSGRLAFEQMPLADVVREFNRYNFDQLVIADPKVARLSVGGAFESIDLHKFLKWLEQTGEVRIEEVPSGEGSSAVIYLYAGKTAQR